MLLLLARTGFEADILAQGPCTLACRYSVSAFYTARLITHTMLQVANALAFAGEQRAALA